jgi:hypothetical protein
MRAGLVSEQKAFGFGQEGDKIAASSLGRHKNGTLLWTSEGEDMR